jgi:lipoate-protein ligase A
MKSADRIVRSSSFDPFRNFAVEDCLFRTADSQTRTLFLWVNDPVVVIGRYQNPWLECRLDALGSDGVPFARRQSGGGAVYHDRGNLCATFMGPKRGFDRRKNIELVMDALGDLGADVASNERNDILAGRRKISGSAYRESGERTFHHLTLLVAADLGRLSRYLQPTLRAGSAKGVASVRSPVANLQDVDGKITVEAVANTLARRFGEDAGEYEELDDSAATAADRDSVEQAIRKWTSWEWLFGGSPEFTVRLGENSGEGILELVVRGGTVAAAHELAPEPTELLELLGVRFGPETANALRGIGAGRAMEGEASSAARAERWAQEAEGFLGEQA